MNRLRFCILVLAALLCTNHKARADDSQAAKPSTVVDSKTLRSKVVCGYQAWFRCLGDGTNEGWLHWSRLKSRVTPESLTVEMWPDTSEFSDEEKFNVPGFTHRDNSTAYLFSSAHPKTVQRHFQWMQQYGIDGVMVQRFVVNLTRPSFDDALRHIRASAANTGRVYAMCYDLTGTPTDKIYDLLTADWQRLVDEQKLTQDERYLHHNDKPVVMVWGFFSDRFNADLANRIIDFFKRNDRYAATLIGGCQWYWLAEKDAAWSKVFRRFDVISPWNVGNVMFVGSQKHASTGPWHDDLPEAKRAGMDYLPVIYPGFGWTNLMGKQTADVTVPRLGGEVYWRQFVTAAELGIDMAYVAMFDEVDEGTAIFKVANDPPTQASLTTFDGLPADWYLRLTGEGTRVIRGEKKATKSLPFKP